MLRVKRGASNRGHHHRDRHRTIIVHIKIPFHGYASIHDPLGSLLPGIYLPRNYRIR